MATPLSDKLIFFVHSGVRMVVDSCTVLPAVSAMWTLADVDASA